MPNTFDMEKQDEFDRGKTYKYQLRRKVIRDFMVTSLVLFIIGLSTFICLITYFV